MLPHILGGETPHVFEFPRPRPPRPTTEPPRPLTEVSHVGGSGRRVPGMCQSAVASSARKQSKGRSISLLSQSISILSQPVRYPSLSQPRWRRKHAFVA